MTTRNARFQQWQALLTNRPKRNRLGEFLVQGVRPISLAVEHGWTIRSLLYDGGSGESVRRSQWAEAMLDSTPAERIAVAPHLMAELGGKEDGAPELVAVVELPADDLDRIGAGGAGDGGPAAAAFLGVVLDRPASPGNIGTVIRSADAFGADAVIICGHAADPYDPKAVRASTGSVFSIPVVRVPAVRDVVDWLDGRSADGADGMEIGLVGTDERAESDVTDLDCTRPTLFAIGNESGGLSTAWREAADSTIRIPIGGGASSLNAAVAASVVLYEAARQRRITDREQ